MKKEFDIIIIGGGVVGCAIARELSKYRLKTLLVEKECDLAMGTSGRNSGVVHTGFYVKPGSLKADLNIGGHRVMPGLCDDLDVPYRDVGKLVVAKDDKETEYLHKLKETGDKNGTRELRIIEGEEIKKLEPNIEGTCALHSPTTAILDPFLLTISLAENAIENGAEILLSTRVTGITKSENGWGNGGSFLVKTNREEFRSDIVINSAGLFSDRIAQMVGIADYKIYPCRGEYHILDKNKRGLINGMVYPVPPRELGGLGVHLTPTTDGNILIGPSAEYIEDRQDVGNAADVMERLLKEAGELLPGISRRDFIRSFAGIRPKLIKAGSKEPRDFVIEESRDVGGFINLLGIESPGLTAAPAIAKKVAGMIKDIIEVNGGNEPKENPDFNPKRKAPPRFSELSDHEKSELIKKNPNYGQIVCRCETVTRQEIIDALKNPLGARSINSVRKRARATCGRCQGGFCIPKIVEITKELFNPPTGELTLMGEGSQLFSGRVRGVEKDDRKRN